MNSHTSNGLFDKMVSEAMEEVACKGWKEAGQNAVTLAAFGMLGRVIKTYVNTLKKPFWWATGVVAAGVLWYIVSGAVTIANGINGG